MNYVYYYADAENEVLEDRFPDLNTQQRAWKWRSWKIWI